MTLGSPDGLTDRTAEDLLGAVLTSLTAGIEELRPAALADEPDAVHQLRTTVRRLRNLLAAFADCFDPVAAAGFGAGLATYGGLLGESRDLEVRAADATTALTALGLVDELSGAVVAPLRVAHEHAHAALVAWHTGPESARLAGLLEQWGTAPPLTGRAGLPAAALAAPAVRRQVRRVLARADAEPGTESEAEERRHDLRKAARRLRHTADAVASVDLGVGGVVLAGRLGQEIQGLLGDHRDALLLADHVRECAARAADRSSYDLVAEHAEDLADGALAGLDAALADLRALARI